ncbi:MAG: ATP phosphoribosyltransferase [Bdellovibrionota bacterium]|nr:MAG: ATP phosphoribosyltransferase [Pseudomonadota bacterium]
MPSLNLAIQKSGRLSGDSISLLKRCGLNFDSPEGRLIVPCNDFPLNLLMVRDDDIPSYVSRGASDLGIAGLNVIEEARLSGLAPEMTILRKLGFGRCRLSIAVPNAFNWEGVSSLQGLRIATSYPSSLENYLRRQDIRAEIVPMTGSVEIAPGMGMADAVCDLVSSGATLRSNGLTEVLTVYESEAVLIGRSSCKETDRLLLRIDGVLKAQHSRYIMMNSSRSAIETIRSIAPGLSQPTVMPLAGDSGRVAIHMVSSENIFWETLEKLKAAGAEDILVLPIEKIMM